MLTALLLSLRTAAVVALTRTGLESLAADLATCGTAAALYAAGVAFSLEPLRDAGEPVRALTLAAHTAMMVAPVAPHDPAEGCGCDLCDAARAELNDWYDDRRVVFLDAVDGGPLPWERAWTPDLALPVANDNDFAGEAA